MSAGRLVDLSPAVPEASAPEELVVHRALRCTFFAPFCKFAGIDSAPARACARFGGETD